MRLLVNVCRTILGMTLVLSGLIKAVDPLGTQYKIDEYLGAAGLASQTGESTTLLAAILLISLEFGLGLLSLLAIQQRLVSKAVVLFMSVMTGISIWLVAYNPVTDCGCFGDAIHLSNSQTLFKNIILTACATITAWKSWDIERCATKWWKKVTFFALMAFVFALMAWAWYYLPPIDFRPYHIGASIRDGMTTPEGQEPPQFETTFIMEKDGKRKEYKLEDYPDSTWTLVDTRTTVTKKGYEPPIHDFTITDHETGENIEEQILSDKGFTILMVAPYLEKADDSDFGKINALYDYTKDHNQAFYCLTSSGDKGIANWIDQTGAEYRFCMVDVTTLKTMIRSNPGLLLIKDGRVIGKWGHNSIPTTNELEKLTGKQKERELHKTYNK